MTSFSKAPDSVVCKAKLAFHSRMWEIFGANLEKHIGIHTEVEYDILPSQFFTAKLDEKRLQNVRATENRFESRRKNL